MATDWTSPKTSDTHTNELAATRGRDESNARMDYTGDTNIPDGTIRWNKTNNRFEIWNATTSTWSVLSSKYLINVDQVDGYDAGNASGNVPVSNGNVNSNLNADKLDGQHGTYFQDRANHTGTQAPSSISPQGSGSGLDADKLDGKHASEFVYTTGGTMTGDLTVPTVNGDILVADTRDQTINPIDIVRKVTVDLKKGSTIGLPNEYYLVWTMRPWTDDTGGPAHQIANGSDGMFYRSGTEASGWGAWYKIWHAGNDGSGSGLDADLLDGKHAGNASGNVPVSNGTLNINLNADLLDGKHLSEIGGGMKYKIFTSSGTFTVPSGVTQVLVTLIGGGGGGSKGGGGSLSGAGGGGGGVYYRTPVTVTPGSSIPVTIGSGGAGGTSSHIDGYAGGTSSFGSYLSATGGGPGRGQGGSSTGGSTGSPSTTYYTQPGGKGMGYGWIDHIGGHGGGTVLGGPAPGVCDSSSRGLVFGGGGSGGGWTANGGDGAPGVCIIEWEE